MEETCVHGVLSNALLPLLFPEVWNWYKVLSENENLFCVDFIGLRLRRYLPRTLFLLMIFSLSLKTSYLI